MPNGNDIVTNVAIIIDIICVDVYNHDDINSNNVNIMGMLIMMRDNRLVVATRPASKPASTRAPRNPEPSVNLATTRSGYITM